MTIKSQYRYHLSFIAYIGMIIITCLMSGCYRYDPYNPYEARDPDQPTRKPAFEGAKASCYWEPSVGSYVWHFEAWVMYPRHEFNQIDTVYAEVYQGPYIVDWFTLGHEKGKYWDTKLIEWLSTDLHCEYYEDYEVDFFVFDRKNNYDAMTVWEINQK